ncbi:hypothetical protein G6F56_001295 [Rhizopus delemar]|nr:hypothetical protein G6F56_001295 [Rhizopus delemar]
MEHVQGGELLVKIKQNPKITEGQARRWFRELIEAVEYIHKNKIVHRDLKPENGNPYYAAPEVITNTPYEGPPADLWSCGVILYAMLSGTLPFQASTMPDLIEKIRTASFAKPRLISRNAQDLLKRLLCIDAQKRITAQECLVHPWMTENLQPTIKTSVSLNTALKDKQSFGSKDIIIKKYHSALFYKTSFFTRIFKRRVQVAPLDVPLIIEEKVPKVTFGKFKNLFSFTKNSRQD